MEGLTAEKRVAFSNFSDGALNSYIVEEIRLLVTSKRSRYLKAESYNF